MICDIQATFPMYFQNIELPQDPNSSYCQKQIDLEAKLADAADKMLQCISSSDLTVTDKIVRHNIYENQRNVQ